ncbi:MAG TPA: hypothetical protein EYP59_21720 [Thiotrichaceae bacterium]|nr:hypothetical protein [Thiotrichaceae bacterium]
MITKLGKAIQDVFEAERQALEAEALVVVTVRFDDIALLIGLLFKMGLPEVLDNHIPSDFQQRDLSWGWTIVIWLAYISRYGDHRKISVEAYIAGMQNTLSELTGQKIVPKDFTDDRLSTTLKYLSKPYWIDLEKELNENTIKIYNLETKTVRCDATCVSGNHQIDPFGLIQFGH